MPPESLAEVQEPPQHAATEQSETRDRSGNDDHEMVATVATVAVVALGAAVFEAALLPGMVLGVAAMLAPSALPKIGTALNRLFRSTVRGVYRFGERAREVGRRDAGTDGRHRRRGESGKRAKSRGARCREAPADWSDSMNRYVTAGLGPARSLGRP
jgi:hypothetical protein